MVSRWTSVCLFVRQSVRISFPDDNLNKHQWIFTKLGMCVDIALSGKTTNSHVVDGCTCFDNFRLTHFVLWAGG